MKRLSFFLMIIATILISIPSSAKAAAGIFASGGGEKTVGQTFTITVSASGAEFDSFEGGISVSGPVDVLAFSPGNATWLPGKAPSNGGQFVGITSPTSSLTVATIKLKAKGVGKGSINVPNGKLARNGVVTGSDSGGASFSIVRAPEPPSGPNVTSSSHPDQNSSYEATTIALSWDKAKGVDAFSYLLDQSENTKVANKTTSTDTTATFPDKTIGTYYFHIKAHNGDGWGDTTHFKITIKEPEAKINPALSAPKIEKIEKLNSFINDIKNGTVSGILIAGTTEPNFVANLSINPTPTIPEGRKLSATADELGNWEINLDYPIVSGFHKITIQGQKDKVLTPISEEVRFEISQIKGGNVHILTAEDEFAPVKAAETPKKSFELSNKVLIYGGVGLAVLILIVVLAIILTKKIRLKKLSRIIQK